MNKDCYYNKIDTYRKNIEPLIKTLKMECNVEQLPMFVTVAVENNETETIYESNVIYASCESRLTDKRIGRLLLLVNDFSTEPPEYIKDCIRLLQDYIDQNGNVLDVALTNDRISDMEHVIDKNDSVVARDRDEKEINDYTDFYEA